MIKSEDIGKPSIKKLINDTDSKIETSLFDKELQELIDEEKGVRYILRQNPTRRDEMRDSMQRYR